MKVYLVGGAVRDGLLGRPITERDWVVVGATQEQMLSKGFQKVGKDFPVFLHPSTKEEYALARTERKTSKGYYGFDCYFSPDVSLEDDLKRRDLTINAIAQDADGTLIDPYDGVRDLREKRLAHVSQAFTEDPVRILRVARFAARFASMGFEVAPETMDLMRSMVLNGEVDALVPERVWQEMERALQEPSPNVFIETLRSCGALSRILPELNALWGTPVKISDTVIIDSGLLTMDILLEAVNLGLDSQSRFAVLLHGLGQSMELVRDICKRLTVPNSYKELAMKVAGYHEWVFGACELNAASLLMLLMRVDAFRKPDFFQQFLRSCEAVLMVRSGLEGRLLGAQQRACLETALSASLSVNPRDLMRSDLDGEGLKEAIAQARIAAINLVLK